MIHYKDTTFCSSKVTDHNCGREFTEQDAIDAEKWWGGKDYPVAYGEFCEEKCIVEACPMSRIKYEPYCPTHAKKAMKG